MNIETLAQVICDMADEIVAKPDRSQIRSYFCDGVHLGLVAPGETHASLWVSSGHIEAMRLIGNAR